MAHSVVEAVFQHAKTVPEKLCLADESCSVTYAQYAGEIGKMAGALKELGISAGDRVVVEASQTITFLACELALHLLGAVFVPLERNCAWAKIQRIGETSEASLILTQKDPPGAGAAIQVVTLAELKAIAQDTAPLDISEFPDSGVISEILFSTGTTGKEKGIVLTHDNDIALAENVICGVEMHKDNVEMIPSPMNHSHGLRRYYGNMVKGATVILATGVMNVKLFFDMVEQYRVNSFDLVPSALSVLLRLSKNKFGEYSDQIRYMQFGSAPLAAGDIEKIRTLLPDTHLYNFYGSTESGCICIYDFNTENDKPKCIGKPAHNAQIVIVDKDRKEITSSQEHTGLLASCGRMNMVGYWKDEAETERAMGNGFIYSEDEAYFDTDGDIILLGRKGDVINTGGSKVAPEEIEEAARQLERIADCGCIGVPDPIKGQVPKLYVQMKKGFHFDPAEIHKALFAVLEPYKVPVYIVEIEEIPRTFNGKLLRKVLRTKHDQEMR